MTEVCKVQTLSWGLEDHNNSITSVGLIYVRILLAVERESLREVRLHYWAEFETVFFDTRTDRSMLKKIFVCT